MDALVTTEWLAKHRDEPDVRVVDGTWHMPQRGRDARAEFLAAHIPGRFAGPEPEPRPGLLGGHIPGSLNLPYETLYRADGTLLATDELRAAMRAAGVDLARPIVTSCGSGVTASVLALALHRLGRPDVAVYDGSWSEWGGRSDTPIAP